MAKINKLWYVVAAVVIIIVIVLVFHVATGNSNSGTIIDNKSQIIRNSKNYDIKKATVDDTSGFKIRIWPKTLPKPPNCGIGGSINKIIGGEVLEFDQQPWAALLDYQYENGMRNYDCGGTLINYKYVITAAHCLIDSRRKLVGVLLGEQNIDTPIDCYRDDPEDCATDKPILYEIAKIIIHPSYNKISKENDIALVQLNAIVEFNEITKPICLPGEDLYSTYRLSKRAFAIGWGLTNSSDKHSESFVKKIVDLPIWDRKTCAQKFKTIGYNTFASQICAGGEGGKDSCTYDSGGALVRLAYILKPTWFLEGIVSFGFKGPCGVEGNPGVYTNVTAHMDWILDTVTT